jgi:hypothetical protein
VLDDDQPRSLPLDSSHVSFTPDGRGMLLHEWGRGCRLMRLPELKVEQLGPVPDSAFAGIGAEPHHLRCGTCDGTSAVFVQDEPEGRVRLYDTSGRFLFSTPAPDE